MAKNAETVFVRKPGLQEYTPCWEAMRTFTHGRHEETTDEIWLVEHPPVFTLGQSGNRQHILNAGDIPVIPIDRGGQVTYHGPGQLIAYTLVDIKRKNLSIRQLVTKLERSVIELLSSYGIKAESQLKAPGVYVNNKKIASIGLRVRRGYAFHGIALNINMDLDPFSRINPCGYAGLRMTQVVDLHQGIDEGELKKRWIGFLAKNLGYKEVLS